MLTKSSDLELLIAVVDCGGFSAAADSLGVQVAKVSRAVSRIESSLNITILNRTTRRVELTSEGRSFVESVRVGLDQIKIAEQEVSSSLVRGRLRVDAASPFIIHQIAPHIKEFNQLYPGIEIELSTSEGYSDLLKNQTDVAIRIGRLEDSTLFATLLGKSQLYIVCSPEYLKENKRPKNVEELLKHRLIGFSTPKVLNNWPLRRLGEIRPNIYANNGEVIRELTLKGNGIACLSSFMIKDDLESGRLVSLLDDYLVKQTCRENINAVYYKSSHLAKRISAFIEFLKVKINL